MKTGSLDFFPLLSASLLSISGPHSHCFASRLADEVEQRTDVRKSGMEGFYANLLTKNVAMGGDVDAHAVSVYTAGSSRQSHVLNEPAAPEAKKSLKFSHTSAAASSSSEVRAVEEEDDGNYSDSADPAESSRYVDRSGTSRPVADPSEEPARKAPRGVTPDASMAPQTVAVSIMETVAPPVPTPVAVPDKTEVIMSAKDRYLARKRALEG